MTTQNGNRRQVVQWVKLLMASEVPVIPMVLPESEVMQYDEYLDWLANEVGSRLWAEARAGKTLNLAEVIPPTMTFIEAASLTEVDMAILGFKKIVADILTERERAAIQCKKVEMMAGASEEAIEQARIGTELLKGILGE